MDEQLLLYAVQTNPTRVELELTERCNLSCKFCYNSQNPIDSDCVNDIIKRLAEEKVPEIVLTGGEPILHPRFSEILQLCSTLFQKTMVQTNGTLIDDSVADLLAENHIFEVNISMHGSTDLHDLLTMHTGSHKAAYEAIKRLIKKNVRVSSNFVMTKENISGLENNLSELYQLGVRCMTLTRFTPAGVGSSNAHLALSREELIRAIETADRFCRNNDGVSILLANSVPLCTLLPSLSSYCEHCHFGASRFYIDINGTVLMCGMSRVPLGNILQNSFAEIKKSSEVFSCHILGKDVPDKCSGCANFRRCRGGCRAAALAVTGDLCGADPYMC